MHNAGEAVGVMVATTGIAIVAGAVAALSRLVWWAVPPRWADYRSSHPRLLRLRKCSGSTLFLWR